MFKRPSSQIFALVTLASVLFLAGAGCNKARQATSPQVEGSSSLEGTNLIVQLPSGWELRRAISDDVLYFGSQDRAWLAGPSDWLKPPTDTPSELRSPFAGCTITQLPIGSFATLEEWFRSNIVYSEEDMWFLGATSTFQTEHFNRGIEAEEGSPNATRTTSIYLNTNNGYITRVSYFDGVDIDEIQRKKLPEIRSGCRSVASSLQTTP